jgi:FolB domain-containing protein
MRRAARTDCIRDAVDYKSLKKDIVKLVEGSSFQLIETMADRVAILCLRDPRVTEVTVCVDKPSALRFARSVAVELTRRAPRVKRRPGG